jgi:protein-tyrosine-phosphatase
VLAGLSIPIEHWRDADREISQVLAKYGLENDELHTAWMTRKYLEQSKITGFAGMDWAARRAACQKERTRHLLALQKAQKAKAYRQAKKNYRHSEAYIHLTLDERLAALSAVADAVASWGSARLFAECIDKTHFDPVRTGRAVDEQALEQVVSRYQQFLSSTEKNGTGTGKPLGLLVHDNNESVAKKHTELMRHFHSKGTLWTTIDNIIETPLFVDSSLTRMVQIADLCSYALRRFVENGETDLFKKVFTRADSVKGKTVSIRHFAGYTCQCAICVSHR